MKNLFTISLFVLLPFGNQFGFAQGFVNLDFESADISQRSGNEIPATAAFPGWTVNAPFVYYNSVSLSGGSISIFNPTSLYPVPPIQGNYYAYLASVNVPGYDIPISLGQTGQVPSPTQSIQFWGNLSGMQISFNGQPLFLASLAQQQITTFMERTFQPSWGKRESCFLRCRH